MPTKINETKQNNNKGYCLFFFFLNQVFVMLS